MLVAACDNRAALLDLSGYFDSRQQCSASDGLMWCLIYLERESPTALVSLLKERSFQVHIAPNPDDLLDALWYHGSAVGCIVIETTNGNGLDELMHALEVWPDLDVLISGPIQPSTGQPLHKQRFERDYSLQHVSRWLIDASCGSLDGGGSLR